MVFILGKMTNNIHQCSFCCVRVCGGCWCSHACPSSIFEPNSRLSWILIKTLCNWINVWSFSENGFNFLTMDFMLPHTDGYYQKKGLMKLHSNLRGKLIWCHIQVIQEINCSHLPHIMTPTNKRTVSSVFRTPNMHHTRLCTWPVPTQEV
jgi:hypothetical protein